MQFDWIWRKYIIIDDMHVERRRGESETERVTWNMHVITSAHRYNLYL